MEEVYHRFIRELIQHKTLTDGLNNESVDGSGWNPSVTLENAPLIFNFIKDKVPINLNDASVLDVGCGQGYFIKYLNDTEGIFAMGIEGSADLQKYFCHDNIVIWDLCKPFNEIDYPLSVLNHLDKKLFDVSFSFEVIEHVAPNQQREFWHNLRTLSKYHVCSIHVENGVNEYHKTMISESGWIDFFNYAGIKIVHHIPRDEWIKEVCPWECSCFFVLEF
jgi:2-polyprenyl-3-methyl-5-hydroxy-6-metoxy-1,4-benzoquinol methylase